MGKILLAILSAVFLNQTSFAQTNSLSTNLTSSASLSSVCVLTGGAISFGTITPGSGQSTGLGTITSQCTHGTTYNISFSSGNSGNQLQRSMLGSSSNDILQYNIYTDSTYSTIIGDGTSGTSHPLTGSYNGRPVTNGNVAGHNVYISPSGSNAIATWKIYGMLNNNQYVTPDNYSDSLTITLTY